jgi:hypothetical protein
MWQDIAIGSAINLLINLARSKESKGKWRKALLKVFTEVARSFKGDAEFMSAAQREL